MSTPPLMPAANGAAHGDELLGVLDGEVAEHDLIDEGEDGGVGADSQRQ